MLVPFPPPRARAAHNGGWKKHCRTAPGNTAALPQTPPAGPAWWRCYQGKHGACCYSTAFLESRAERGNPIATEMQREEPCGKSTSRKQRKGLDRMVET